MVDVLIPHFCDAIARYSEIVLPHASHEVHFGVLSEVTADAYRLVILAQRCNTVVDALACRNETENEPFGVGIPIDFLNIGGSSTRLWLYGVAPIFDLNTFTFTRNDVFSILKRHGLNRYGSRGCESDVLS